MATPFPITMPPGTVLGRLPLPQAGDADAIPLLQLFAPASNSLGADVLLNNNALFFDGPSIPQGTSGTWFASGTVTLSDSGGGTFRIRLWDGATVIASTTMIAASSAAITATLSGFITAPAGNLRMSVKDISSANGRILFNATGDSKDSTLTVMRIG